ncbi:MAG: 30S ribosomal protein S2 [bacterium]|nr:30S ribosomal protein S2 [bacterium]MDZ4296167.1 30S ribosomal protein S2 [Patescibacteria group bacterium]
MDDVENNEMGKEGYAEAWSHDQELAAMFKAGVHFGHRKSRVNAKMMPYIFTVRNNVHIIDLAKTKEKLAAALAYLRGLQNERKTILWVGTRPAARELVEQLAVDLGMPYVMNRWVGGTLTNFTVIAKRLAYFRDLEEKQRKGELEKYTKKEQHLFQIELRRLAEKFGGIKHMAEIPHALFITDLYEDEIAAREAKRKGVPVVAIADTNTDPTFADYLIPANDDATSSLTYLFGRIRQTLTEAEPVPAEAAVATTS